MSRKIWLVGGTRPEVIKLSRLRQLGEGRRDIDVAFVATGQHREMVEPLYAHFGFRPTSDLALMKPGQSLNELLARTIEGLKGLLLKDRPDWLVVQGDTTTAAAAAMAGFHEKIPVAHVEAGLRTGDLTAPWPEEFNRRLISLAAGLHFAPTEAARRNLIKEGHPEERILVSGNTGIDALLWTKDKATELAPTVHGLPASGFVLVTLHRRESLGDTLRGMVRHLLKVPERTGVSVLFPLHRNPDVRGLVAKELGIEIASELSGMIEARPGFWLCEPLEYPLFVAMMGRCRLILTDSGGLQEEGPALGKPVLVAREVTERPEAIEAGGARLVGTGGERILSEIVELLSDEARLGRMSLPRFPFGDGHASERILAELLRR